MTVWSGNHSAPCKKHGNGEHESILQHTNHYDIDNEDVGREACDARFQNGIGMYGIQHAYDSNPPLPPTIRGKLWRSRKIHRCIICNNSGKNAEGNASSAVVMYIMKEECTRGNNHVRDMTPPWQKRTNDKILLRLPTICGKLRGNKEICG